MTSAGSLASRLRPLRRVAPVVWIGLVVIVLASAVALFAPQIATHEPLRSSVRDRLQAPSPEHLFGTDGFGRDVFSRVVYGARVSIGVGLAVVVLSTVLGTITGLIAGYFRSLDHVIMRVMDGLMAFPVILLAIAIMGALGPGVQNVILALSIVYWPRTARIVRGSVLSLRELDFVEGARALGASDGRVIARHLLPSVASPVLVQATFVLAAAVLAEAGLSFIGAGIPAPNPSWGNILAEGRTFMRNAPWMTVFPGVAITTLVLALNLVGDGLIDYFDPKRRRNS
jgi:peptide/nickel transport system permease protein